MRRHAANSLDHRLQVLRQKRKRIPRCGRATSDRLAVLHQSAGWRYPALVTQLTANGGCATGRNLTVPGDYLVTEANANESNWFHSWY